MLGGSADAGGMSARGLYTLGLVLSTFGCLDGRLDG